MTVVTFNKSQSINKKIGEILSSNIFFLNNFFLNRLASINSFVNNSAMLLFLQTSLSKHQMDYYMKTRTPGGIRSLIHRLHEKELKRDDSERRPRTKTFSAEYPSAEK